MRAAGWIALLASIGMALAGGSPPSHATLAAICGDPTHSVPIPTRQDKQPGRDCPMGCHAVCPRRESADGDDRTA